MKKVYLIGIIFMAFGANAQQMVVPSSFDENRMIVKVMDKDGNFVPVDENTLTDSPEKQIEKSASSQKNKTEKFEKSNNKKKFKRKQKTYSIQRSTFTPETYDNLPAAPSTFRQETMSGAQKDLLKEMTFFEECTGNDPNCREYEVDDKGEVIFQ